MADIGSIFVKFGADTSGFKKGNTEVQSGIKQTTSLTGGFGSMLKSIGPLMATAFSATAVINLGKRIVELAAIQDKAEAKVQQAVKQTGQAAGFTALELQKIAGELQKITTFGDEDILNNVTAQLLTFTNITGENFKKAQVAVMDLATLLDGDLKNASIQLGKALNDPIANLSALSRSGIQFSESQKTTIKQLVESNKLYDAQALILAEVNRQYGGQAEKMASLPVGKLQQMQNAWGDIGEVLGRTVAPAVVSIADALKSIAEDFSKPLDEKGWLGQLLQKASILIKFSGMLRAGVADVKKEITNGVPDGPPEFAGFVDKGKDVIDTIAEIEAQIKTLEERQKGESISKAKQTQLEINGWKDKIAAITDYGKADEAAIKASNELRRDQAGLISGVNLQIATYKDLQEHSGTQEEYDRLTVLISRLEATKKGYEDLAKSQKLVSKSPASVGGGVTPVGDRSLATTSNTPDKALKDFKDSTEAAKSSVIDLGSSASSAFSQIGESLGRLMSGETNIKGFFNNILNMVADFMKQFGEAIIGIGTAKIAVDLGLASNPALAIAAGVALVAAGSYLDSLASKGMRGFANGTNNYPGGWSVVGERGPEFVRMPTGSAIIPNQKIGNGMQTVVVTGDMRLQGRELVALFSQEMNKQSRI